MVVFPGNHCNVLPSLNILELFQWICCCILLRIYFILWSALEYLQNGKTKPEAQNNVFTSSSDDSGCTQWLLHINLIFDSVTQIIFMYLDFWRWNVAVIKIYLAAVTQLHSFDTENLCSTGPMSNLHFDCCPRLSCQTVTVSDYCSEHIYKPQCTQCLQIKFSLIFNSVLPSRPLLCECCSFVQLLNLHVLIS